MDGLVVPPAPQWYKSSVVACAPDNTLVYGSKNDLVVIREKNPGEPWEVQIIHGAHFKHIASVSLNKKWNEPHTYAASAGEDNLIKIWNLTTFEKKITNKDHTEHNETVIGAVFAGDDRVISASVNGFVVVWNINTNESKVLKDLFKNKVSITCLSSCPHAAWLIAFGLNNGGVIVADLRRHGQVLYKLRGHYQAVVSLSWCPATVNVFPRGTNNRVKCKSPETTALNTEKQETGKGDGETQEKSDESQVKINNPWVGVHSSDGKVALEKEQETASGQDFLKECEELKKKILGLEVTSSKRNDVVETKIQDREIEPEEERNEVQNRPFPQLFDPSGDFLDDSGVDSSPIEEKSFENELQKDEIPLPNENKENPPEVKESTCEENLGRAENEELQKNENKVNLPEVEESTCEENLGRAENEELQKNENKESLPEVIDLTIEEITEQAERDQRSSPEGKDETCEGQALEEQKNDTEPSGEDSGIAGDTSVKEPVEEEPRTEYLLASSAKDKSVYIWRAGTDGRMQTFFYANRKENRRDKTPTWTTICWASADTILSSSPTGEILSWTVPKPKDSKKRYTVIHFEHNSHVFNIVTPPKYFTEYNWRDRYNFSLWTWGQDGRLINYDTNEEKFRFSYLTIPSSITCFGTSALDPNRLAIGLRDGGIRIWDLSLPYSNIVGMIKHQQRFTHKLSVVAWHPTQETVLGFGTEEGRVGFIELNSKKSTLFSHFFRSQIYKVEWGPIKGDINNLGLYALSEGKIIIYSMEKNNESAIQIELPEKLYAYKFAWKPDFTLLLINGKDGCLVLLRTDLTTITTIYPNEKGLNSIVWHPDASTDKTDISPRCNWFAATTSKGLMIFDCTSIEKDESFADKIVATLEGHLKPPLALAWCPFEGNRIVSTAADGLALVWDVTTKTLIATFVNPYVSHHVSVAWHSVDPDLIITGDKIVQVWNIFKNPPKTDEEFLAARKRLLTKSSKNEAEKEDKNKIKIVAVKPKSSKNCIVPAFYVSNDENISAQVANMRKLMSPEENVTVIDKNTNPLDPLQILGCKEQVSRLLDANYANQKSEGKYKSCEMISLWKGNIGDHIQSAITENRVTSSIIALAPMVSPKLWQEACLTYAKKLSEDETSDPLETAMYFLACHKVEEAINCLCLNSLFREALALAKERLPENSDITRTVVEKWAEHCMNTGNFENAAYCYISINNFESAAKALARRNHKEFLTFALELAEKVDNKGLCESIKFKITEVQSAEQGTSAENVCEETNIPSRIEAVLNTIAKNEEGKSEENSAVENESQSENGEELVVPE